MGGPDARLPGDRAGRPHAGDRLVTLNTAQVFTALVILRCVGGHVQRAVAHLPPHAAGCTLGLLGGQSVCVCQSVVATFSRNNLGTVDAKRIFYA